MGSGTKHCKLNFRAVKVVIFSCCYSVQFMSWFYLCFQVLKVTKLGHRKRILASLGDKHVDNFIDSKELDLSKLVNIFSCFI